MNIIIPLLKLKNFNLESYSYPVILTELNGNPLIHYLISNIKCIKGDKNVIFILSRKDCLKFKIDSVVNVLYPEAKTLILNDIPRGAPCTILMASDYIEKNNKLLILNADQYFNCDLNKKIDLINNSFDLGVLYFEAIHPRWSYILFEDDKRTIVRSEEKKPISKNAIAGFYYFKNFDIFFNSACKSIENEDELEGIIYTSSLINQAILLGYKAGGIKVKNSDYYSFYSISRFKEFEKYVNKL